MANLWPRFIDNAKLRLIIYRNYLIDIWLVVFALPLYYRCAHLWRLRGACYRNATWAYVGGQKKVQNAYGRLPHGTEAEWPTFCDHCIATDIGTKDMKRVGLWYRTPVWERSYEKRLRVHRPAPEIRS